MSRREHHPENRATLLMIAGRDLAAVLFQDPIADAQSQASSLPYRFGGEERIEDFARIDHTWTAVVELCHHLAGVLIKTDPQHAISRDTEHRVGSVVDDVQKYL